MLNDSILRAQIVQAFKNIHKSLVDIQGGEDSEIKLELLENYVRCLILTFEGVCDDKRSA